VSELSNAVNTMKAESEKKDAEILELKNSLQEKEEILKAENDKAAVELIENAIKEGKVKSESREKLIVDAKNSLSVVKSMLDSMATPAASRFTNVANSGAKTEVNAKDGWDIRRYEEEDPKALADLYTNNKAEYDRLYNETYKK